MFDFRKLLKLLEKELSYQEKLLELLSKERVAIVRLNQDELDTIFQLKQKILDDVIDLEKRRSEIFEALRESNKREEPLKFTDVVEMCPASEGKGHLQHVGENLKKVALNVREMNDHNSALIKQSLGLISSTIAIMKAIPESDLPTYTPSGTLTTAAEDPAFSAKRQLSREA